MATSVTWWALSQSCSVSRPRTVVANSATSCVRPPVSAGMRTQAVTCALCTSSAAARSTITSTVLLLSGAPQNNGVARQESPKQTFWRLLAGDAVVLWRAREEENRGSDRRACGGAGRAQGAGDGLRAHAGGHGRAHAGGGRICHHSAQPADAA